jgi:D-alanyl-D-alanine carboxypeptidase/D-alanyl-D-alanine-endopeptidase (penicillin-binding protein 4)
MNIIFCLFLKKWMSACAGMALLLSSVFSFAQLPVPVADALKRAGIPEDAVAVYVQSVDSKTPSLTHQANKSMNPASVMKLVTTHAALDLLTPAYRWKTEVYRDGNVSNGLLEGNLIIKGYGDPNFKAQDFWRLLMSVQQSGIQEVKGNLLIDKSFFAKSVGARETFDSETWRAYNASPSAFVVSGRNTSFKFTVLDGRVLVNQEFALPQIQIVNQMKLANNGCGEWRNRFNYSVTPKELARENGVVVTFNGVFSAECGERYLELSVLNDELYAWYTFKKLWQELGGKISGTVQVQDLPLSTMKVLEQFSAPLGEVIRDINKWSNNLMARQLLLTLAAEKHSVPATEIKGEIVVKEWLNNKQLDTNQIVIENGSGLSRIERISAAHLGQLLVAAYQSPIMPELMASMPILAMDGTVKKRLKDSAAQGRAHLKTGSIDGVSAIAGYVLDAKNCRQVMVVLVNHANAANAKNMQDSVIEWVYAQP